MSKNTGGPAFPRQPHRLANGMLEGNNEGMTLRDYFAAKAMQGFCVATVEDSPVGGWDFKYLSEHAYRCADAMIAEREK